MDVLNEFLSAIEIEYENNLREYTEEINLPDEERIAKGVLMTNLTVEFDFYDGLPNNWCNDLPGLQKYIYSAKIFCDNNISKFKEGTPVYLINGNFHFELEIEEDSTENFILKPNDYNVNYCYIDCTNYPKHNWKIIPVKTDIGTRLLRTAADILCNDRNKLQKIESFLNGFTSNTYKNNVQKIGYLNDSQNDSYLNAINASNFCIIQGPPGTGKTETIGFITKYLVDLGLKVFITAPTHTAINNCLKAVSSRINDNRKVIKIGEKASNREVTEIPLITKKTRLTYSSYLNNNNFSKQGIAIGSTAYSLCYPASKKLDGWEFDVCIIDEASQLSIPLSIAAMCRTNKYIVVGDHKQLDPIIPKGSNNEMFAESVFSRLARLYPKDINLLNVSYRLNKSLIRIPNILFYENKLQSATITKVDETIYRCLFHEEILNNEAHQLILHNVFDANGRSPYEATLVSEIVIDLINNGVSLRDIGVLSPYRAQIREIKKVIKKAIPPTLSSTFNTLFVDTVDSMQGQEKKYIIYSLANSHPLESKRRLDFFYSPNRLNVAITRAINKCLVIANYKVFDIIDEELKDINGYKDLQENLEIFKRYYALSTKIEVFETDDANW